MTGSNTAMDRTRDAERLGELARSQGGRGGTGRGLRLRLDGELATVVLDKVGGATRCTVIPEHLVAPGRDRPGPAPGHRARAVLLRAEGTSFCAGLDRSVLIGGENGAKTLLDLADADRADAET